MFMNKAQNAPFSPSPLPGPPDPLWCRRFSPGDLAFFQQRGGRIPQEEWLKIHGYEAALIAFYERVTGIPFCGEDMPALQHVLAMTSKLNIFRAIKKSATWPVQNPGLYLIRHGFVTVQHLIEKSPHLQWSPMSRRKGEPRVKSGMTPEIAEKLKAMKREKVEKEMAQEKTRLEQEEQRADEEGGE